MVANPMVSLASSVHAGPLTFALLLGSEISVDVGVPSGWNLMVDLVRRLAALHGEDPEPDPIGWHRQHFGTEPDYSGVLAELAPSPGDRRNLLASYFEPTHQEREEGQKVPTKAHRAIASLVASGFVKLIVTTNFDRLLEAALTDAGIDPTIVSSPEHASGAVLMCPRSPDSVCERGGVRIKRGMVMPFAYSPEFRLMALCRGATAEPTRHLAVGGN